MVGDIDLNHDGLDDIVVGSPYSDTFTGAMHVFFSSGL